MSYVSDTEGEVTRDEFLDTDNVCKFGQGMNGLPQEGKNTSDALKSPEWTFECSEDQMMQGDETFLDDSWLQQQDEERKACRRKASKSSKVKRIPSKHIRREDYNHTALDSRGHERDRLWDGVTNFARWLLCQFCTMPGRTTSSTEAESTPT